MTRILIAGGGLLDGRGGERVRADVLVEGERIAAVGGDLSRRDADLVLDAGDRIVAPGFIDLHTHYDAQVFWDPALSSSCHHGVTSVISGNCGFSLAPYAAEHRDIVLRMLRDLEDMPADTLAAAVPAAEPSFEGYLADVERQQPLLNFGCFVGHSTLRIAAMGEAAYERAAQPHEIAAMAEGVARALAAGAMGFATKTLPGARPSPSQFASAEETEALLRVLGRHGRGVAMFNPGGAFDLEKVYATQPSIGRPFTWIALLSMPDGSHHARVALHRRWREKGSDVRPQVSCRPLVAQCSLAMPSAFRAEALTDLNGRPDAERLAAYASPSWRERARAEFRSITRGPVEWKHVRVLSSASDPSCEGRSLAELANECGRSAFDLLVDLAVADRLATQVVVEYGNGDPVEVAKLLAEDGAVLGLSDAGAHPQQSCDGVMPTDLLGPWVRERRALSLEQAVHKLSQEPAELLGLEGRGVVAPGAFADLVVFDPGAIAPGPIRSVSDLPAGRERLLADRPSGVHHVLVNGVVIRQDEKSLAREISRRPGQLLFPG